MCGTGITMGMFRRERAKLRMKRGFVALWIAVMLAFSARDAVAELVHSTEYRSHPVRGSTPRTVIAYMNAHPIIDPDDGPAWANLTHDHDLTIRTAANGGTCRVTDLTFRWRFVLTVPKAVDYKAMDSRTRSMWENFVAALKSHEETHRTIFVGCGEKFVPAAERLTGPANCAGLERKVRRTIEQAYKSCMTEQRAFESRDRPRILGLALVKAAKGQ
jgi:predicted secreted Zn-dependent protease